MKKLLFSLILLSLFCISVKAQISNESMGIILEKTQIISTYLLQTGYDIDQVYINSALYKGEVIEYKTLYAGTTYEFLGNGSDGITDMDVILYDDNGSQVIADTKADNVPVVIYTPTRTQTIKIKVLLYNVAESYKNTQNLYSLVVGYKI